MKLAALCFTASGHAVANRVAEKLAARGEVVSVTRCAPGKLAAWTAEQFVSNDAIVFVGALGIAVRALSGLPQNKATDPAVLCVDEQAQFVIPVLSGHLGGANRLAQEIAEWLTAIPVITTATDVSGTFAVDSWAKDQRLLVQNPGNIKRISAALLRGETVSLASVLPVSGDLPQGVVLASEQADVVVSYHPPASGKSLWLLPQNLVLGVGCRKGVSAEAIEQAVAAALRQEGVPPNALCAVCSVDQKAKEPGLLRFCHAHRLPLVTYSPEVLQAQRGAFTTSEFVRKTIGCDNVCERSVAAHGAALFQRKAAHNGVTTALGALPQTLSFGKEKP